MADEDEILFERQRRLQRTDGPAKAGHSSKLWTLDNPELRIYR